MIKLIRKLAIIACLAFSTLALTQSTPQLSTFAMELDNLTEPYDLTTFSDMLDKEHLSALSKLLQNINPNLKNDDAKKHYKTVMDDLEEVFATIYENYQIFLSDLVLSVTEAANTNKDLFDITVNYGKILKYLKTLFDEQLKTNRDALTKIESVKKRLDPVQHPFVGCSDIEKQFYYGFDKLCWYLLIIQQIFRYDIRSLEHYVNNATDFDKNQFINNCCAACTTKNLLSNEIFMKNYSQEEFKQLRLRQGCYIHITHEDIAVMNSVLTNILTLTQ